MNIRAGGFSFLLLTVFLISIAFSAFPQTLNLNDALLLIGGEKTADLRWDPFFRSGKIISGRHEASFIAGEAGDSGMVLLNHRDVLTLPLPYLNGGILGFPESFVTQVGYIFTRYREEEQLRPRIAAIVLDPGHGGRDPGTVWTYNVNGRTIRVVEKDIVLNVGLQVYALLVAAFPDKTILLTRKGDTNPSLEERVTLANSVPLAENESVAFVSIHANSSFNRNARGFEIYFLNPGYRRSLIDRSTFTGPSEVLPILNSMLEHSLITESILLANSILNGLKETVGHLKPSRGIKPAEWFVVRNTRMPSVLVELGFVSNQTDALLMTCDLHLAKLAQALFKGISDFISVFER